MAKSLEKSGMVREFMANIMMGVKNGETKVEEARVMVKLAEKINESYYAEIKVSELALKLGRKAVDFGDLPVNK